MTPPLQPARAEASRHGALARLLMSLAAMLSVTLSSHAQPNSDAPPDPVTIALASCAVDGIDSAELLEDLRVELAPAELSVVPASALQVGEADAEPVLWLRACGGEAAQVGMIQDGVLGHLQSVDLSDSPKAMHPRTLALALAEYYRARRRAAESHGRTVETTAQATPPDAAQALSPALTPAERPPDPSDAAADEEQTSAAGATFGFFAGLSLRAFTHDGTWLLGPEAGGWVGPLRAGLSIVGHYSRDRVGSVTLFSATAFLSYQPWVVGQSLVFGPRVRGELGGTYGVGQGDDGARGDDAFALQSAVLLEAPLVVPLGEQPRAEIVPACGFATGLRAHADARDLATTRGFFVGISLVLRR